MVAEQGPAVRRLDRAAGTPAVTLSDDDEHARHVVAEAAVVHGGADRRRRGPSIVGQRLAALEASRASQPRRSLRPVSTARDQDRSSARPTGRGCSGRDRVLGVGPHDGRRDPPRGVVEVRGTAPAGDRRARHQRRAPPTGTADVGAAPDGALAVEEGRQLGQPARAGVRPSVVSGRLDLGGTGAHRHGPHCASAQCQRCESASRRRRGTRVGRAPRMIIDVKTRSHRLTSLAVRIVPLAAVLVRPRDRPRRAGGRTSLEVIASAGQLPDAARRSSSSRRLFAASDVPSPISRATAAASSRTAIAAATGPAS